MADSSRRRIKASQKGFSTLEILLAMAILMITLFGAVLTVSNSGGMGVTASLSGSRSLGIDSRANSEALRIAQKHLESAQALAKKDFLAVKSQTTNGIGGFYDNELVVTDISQCAKKLTDRAIWAKNSGTQSSELATVVTSSEEALKVGGDCGSLQLTPGEWSYPTGAGDLHITSAQGTDIDVINVNGVDGVINLAVNTNATANEDFYTAWPPYDSTTPDYTGIDLGGEGANAVDVAYYPELGKYYAFVAVNFDEIKQSPNPAQNTYGSKFQLQVVDVTDYQTLSASDIVAKRFFPNVEGKCSAGSCPGARSLYYYDKKVYVGTHEFPYLATDRHEFYIYDVSTPTNPVLLGSKKITHNINKIVVQGKYAFLATSDNTGELHVYDVGSCDPVSCVIGAPVYFDAKKFNGDASDYDAVSLYVAGNRAYLGRAAGSNPSHPNLYVLDISDPAAGIALLGAKYVPANGSNAYINDIVAMSDLVFLSTGDTNEEFQIFSVADPVNIVKVSHQNCLGSLPNIMSALDIEGKRIFAAFRSNDIIKLFDWGNTACP